jgi:hypothetical protein
LVISSPSNSSTGVPARRAPSATRSGPPSAPLMSTAITPAGLPDPRSDRLVDIRSP